MGDLSIKAFSILSGSSATAALISPPPLPHLLVFQYPQRIECDCGFDEYTFFPQILHLSVSSADRVRLRLGAAMRQNAVLYAFSILSGSSATAADNLAHRSRCATSFQYPQRIECDCGHNCERTICHFFHLSVSSADRV